MAHIASPAKVFRHSQLAEGLNLAPAAVGGARARRCTVASFQRGNEVQDQMLRRASILSTATRPLVLTAAEAKPRSEMACSAYRSSASWAPAGAFDAEPCTLTSCPLPPSNYIQREAQGTLHAHAAVSSVGPVDGSVEIAIGRARAPVFTEEKARMLRQKMREADSHHDTMYHSHLASRLA